MESEIPESLRERFRWGDASRTDAVLTRHYDSETGQETRERKVTIYLRRGQPMEEMMLDLAHELVHATSRPAWDPYDPKLTAAEYIRVAIEGAGGEVEAVQAECRVSLELFTTRVAGGARLDAEKTKSLDSRCTRYGGSLAMDVIRKDFYRVGRWNTELQSRLGEGARKLLPLLSSEKPSLYSSTGGAPYPVALLEEYRQMTTVACENSRRRAATLAEDGDSSLRSPASVSEIEQSNRLFLTRRCHIN